MVYLHGIVAKLAYTAVLTAAEDLAKNYIAQDLTKIATSITYFCGAIFRLKANQPYIWKSLNNTSKMMQNTTTNHNKPPQLLFSFLWLHCEMCIYLEFLGAASAAFVNFSARNVLVKIRDVNRNQGCRDQGW